MVLVLLCGAATAENFHCQLPETANVYEMHPLCEGEQMLLITQDGLYRVSLADGSYERIADVPEMVSNTNLLRNAAGQITLVGAGYDEDWNNQLVVYVLDETAGTWQLVSQWPMADMLDADEANVNKVLVSGDTAYLTFYGDNKPKQLVRVQLETGESQLLGDFSTDPWSDTTLFLRGETLCGAETDYNANALLLFTYDSQTGKIDKETHTSDTLPLWTANDLCYVNGRYYALMSDNDVRGLYSGETLETMTCVASPLTWVDDILLVREEDVLICSGTLLMSSRVVSDAAVTLVLSNIDARDSASYTLQNGVTFRSVFEQTTADILNTRSSDVDILCVRTDDTVSLKLLKDKGYFVDLSGSAIISAQVNRLYPGFQKALMTDDGKIIGWYESVETLLPDGETYVLDDHGMTFPETILEMCQQITALNEEGVFADEGMVPLDYPTYTRLDVLRISLKRYLNEQQLLGNRITLDNAELQELLSYIIEYVPEDEDAFPSGEDTYAMYMMDVSMAITADCHMPLKVGVSSPGAIPAEANVLVVNPYSQHKEEAIRYLEYYSQRMDDETQYRIFADMTEPLESSYQVQQIESTKAQKAALEAQEQTSEVKQEIAELTQRLARAEEARYIISTADIAAWQQVAPNIVVPEENYFTDDLNRLLERLASGNLTVDGFVQEGNRYFDMVYQERGE